MADLSPDKIIEPISEDQPCGPDLDMEDMDFMTFMAELDGKMPTRYFSFDPASIDFSGIYEQIDGFLDRALDVRLLIPLAKLKILQGDIDGFVEAIEATNAVLKAHWSDVHPADDFIDLRMALLSTLDDMPTSVLPLQHATLFRSRRAGPITLRKWQLANGDVSPREDEEMVDGGTLMSEIGAADADEMKAIIEKMERGRDAINSVRTVCISEGDFESAPAYERLPQAFESIIEMISKGTGADAGGEDAEEGDAADGADAGGAVTSGGVMVQMPTGDVATREDAIDALFAAERYYALYEPSSPNVLLLREARAAANKTFAELVSDLLPSSSNEAFFAFGKEPWFEVSVNDINSRNPVPDYDGDGEVETEESSGSSWEDAGLDDGPTSNDEPADDGWTSNNYGGGDTSNDEPEPVAEEAADDGWTSNSDSDDSASDDATEEAAADSTDDGWNSNASDGQDSTDESEAADADSGDDGWSSSSDSTDEAEDAEDTADDVAADDQAEEETEAKPKFVANTRPEALALIEKVRAYYRIAEPSSPVALMLDRAVELSTKNFIGLLREVLPDGHLKVKSAPEGGSSDSSW